MKPHRFHPEADEEYTRAAQYYATVDPELGGRFYDEIERVIAEIRKAPHRFRVYDPPAQRYLANGFPFAVVYFDKPDQAWILAVMPLRRQPDYWKHCLG